jgi:hypothetical protein
VGRPALTAANVFPTAYACPWTHRSEAAHSPRSGRIRDRAQDLFSGPLYLRGVILDQDFPPGYAERLTDAVLRSLGAKSPDRS